MSTPDFSLRAVIEESLCIGCTVCIKACPYDSIMGGYQMMHTVLSDLCTGCGACVEPCPMACITMTPTGATTTPERLEEAENRKEFHDQRIKREAEKKQAATVFKRKESLYEEVKKAHARKQEKNQHK